MPFELKRSQEIFNGLKLEIECLANLDDTIDRMHEELKARGKLELFEALCPFFGVVWPSARMLAERLVREDLKGKRVIELGCGLAIPSLVAALRGAEVVATDFHPEVPKFLERNCALNSVKLRYEVLDWADCARLGKFDWVLASDVLYEREHAPSLAGAIDELLDSGGQALVSDPARPYLQTFLDGFPKSAWNVELETASAELRSDSSVTERGHRSLATTKEGFVVRLGKI